MARDFYLVQRIKRAPYKRHQEAFPDAKVMSNPFGYGRLGDYELDYMGSAEFEFGAIPEAFDRLAKAGKDIMLEEWTYNGHELDVLYIKKNGTPYDAWRDWAEGRSAPSEYNGKRYDQARFYGKEKPYELEERIDGAVKPRFGDDWRTDVWWALGEDVMWAFKADGHLPRMLESMAATQIVELRGAA